MPADKEYGNGSGALKQGSYTVCNIHFQYNLQLGPVVNKPTNKRYYANQYSRRANSGNFYGKPRNAVFNLKWKMQPSDKIRPSENPFPQFSDGLQALMVNSDKPHIVISSRKSASSFPPPARE